MNKIITTLLLLFTAFAVAQAQGTVKGRVLDKTTNSPLEFINVVVRRDGETAILKGAISDSQGNFNISGLGNGKYVLTATFTGYKDATRRFTISPGDVDHTYPAIYMSEDTKALDEVVVTGQRSEMKLEVDRKSFSVDQQISNAGGSASDALENIPSVEVDNDGNVSLRGNSSVEVWINGKQSGLTSDNRADILRQLPAESIDRIEVIDNPSAKFSAEGSAGIINIVLKKDRKAGYYGSVQAGADSRGGTNTSVNFNYNSSLLDAYASVGLRHRAMKGGSDSHQTYTHNNGYQNYRGDMTGQGNNIFSRAGLTFHVTKKDDIGLSGMFMFGGRNDWNYTPYHYGSLSTVDGVAPMDNRLMIRRSKTDGENHMYYGEFSYRHNFSDKHFLDLTVDYNRWKSDDNNIYRDSTTYYDADGNADESLTAEDYQLRPTHINNRRWEVKLDHENQITENVKLQAGYQGNFSKENTPQESYIDSTSWRGGNMVEDRAYFNRFIYKNDIHAWYATVTSNFGNFGVMAGLRGEYWKVNTESYDWYQERDASLRDKPFKKDYFQLFPSVFLSYNITKDDQLQLNYTRRLRRPWGGELNSFKNTRDATLVEFGNPELTPEYSNSFSLNYLRTWTQHSLLVSAYYRPTSDVIQRIQYRSSADGLMYQTNYNVANSVSTGLEITAKDKLWRILDLSTNVNLYYYKLDPWAFDIDGQTVTGDEQKTFSWNARMQASLMLPYDISVQLTGRYRSRKATAQGYRKANGAVDLGVRKTFFNKALTVSLNCRDIFNTRKWHTIYNTPEFFRDQKNWFGGRRLNFTISYSFGNSKQKPSRPQNAPQSGYESGEEE